MKEKTQEEFDQEAAEAAEAKARELDQKERKAAISLLSAGADGVAKIRADLPSRNGHESESVKGARSTMAHTEGILRAEAERLTRLEF